MSCYHPLFAYCYGVDPTTQKMKIKILPRRADDNIAKYRDKYGDDLMLLPCGHCIGCVQSYARAWSNRIMIEASHYSSNCFITLTYENAPEYPLKSDVQKFMKRLRKAHPERVIRFFACGERGEKTKRSHYHLIIFNYDFPDKKLLSTSKLNNELYVSQELTNLWPLGIHSIGELTPSSAAYTARYSMKKKLSGFNDGEFVLMSRRPGIGREYFDTHKNEIFWTDSIYCKLAPGQKMQIPRYYRQLADASDWLVPGYSGFKDRLNKKVKLQGSKALRSLEFEEEKIKVEEDLAIAENTQRRYI